jgi:hypothetical protein
MPLGAEVEALFVSSATWADASMELLLVTKLRERPGVVVELIW